MRITKLIKCDSFCFLFLVSCGNCVFYVCRDKRMRWRRFGILQSDGMLVLCAIVAVELILKAYAINVLFVMILIYVLYVKKKY